MANKTPSDRILKTVVFTQPMNIFGALTKQVSSTMEILSSLKWDGEKVICTSKHDIHSGQEIWILPAAIATLGWA